MTLLQVARRPSTPELDALKTQWLTSQSLAAATDRAYRFEIDRFFRWLKSSAPVLCPGLLIAYLDALSTDDLAELALLGCSGTPSRGSLLQAKRIVRLFVRWAVERAAWPVGVLDGLRAWLPPTRPMAEKPGLSKIDLRAQLSDRKKVESARPRSDRRRNFIVAASFWLGLTPSELARLRRADIQVGVTPPCIQIDGTCHPIPFMLVERWDAWLQCAPLSEFAVSSLGSDPHALTAGAVAAIIRRGSRHQSVKPTRLSSRALRGAALRLLREHGWNDDELRHHFRRKAIVLPPATVRSQKSLSKALGSASVRLGE